MRRFLLLLSLVILTGCGNYKDKLAPARNLVYSGGPRQLPPNPAKDKYYNTWPPETRKAIDNHLVLVGMDKLQVLASTSLEEPWVQKRVENTANGVVETWTIWKTMGGWAWFKTGLFQVNIVFENGKVIEVKRR